MLLRYPECTVMKQAQVCLRARTTQWPTKHVTLQSTNNFTAKYLQKILKVETTNLLHHTIQHNQAMKERMLAADDMSECHWS